MLGGRRAEQSSSSSSDISSARSGALFALPPPAPLDIHDSNAAEKWREFEQAWRNLFGSYEIAPGTRDRTDCNVVDSDRGAEARFFPRRLRLAMITVTEYSRC